MITLVVVENEDAGPYTLHKKYGVVIPVSHKGPFLNHMWFANTSDEVINKLKSTYGEDAIEVFWNISAVECAEKIVKILKSRK